MTYTQCKSFDQAAECLKAASKTLQLLDMDRATLEMAAIHQNIGAVNNSMGRYNEAIDRSKDALKYYGR